MTTIIVTQDFIAGDGLARNGHDRTLSRSVSKVRTQAGRVYALSGSAAIFDPLIDWHSTGADVEKVPKCSDQISWSLVALNPDGTLDLYTKDAPYADRNELPFALGSGGDYALGAIAAGADVRRAIEIAALYDTNTGGDIQVVNIAEALEKSKVATALERTAEKVRNEGPGDGRFAMPDVLAVKIKEAAE